MVSENVRAICEYFRATRRRKHNLSYKNISAPSVNRELILWHSFQLSFSSVICAKDKLRLFSLKKPFYATDMNVLIWKIFFFQQSSINYLCLFITVKPFPRLRHLQDFWLKQVELIQDFPVKSLDKLESANTVHHLNTWSQRENF